jgi:hypothetical protein
VVRRLPYRASAEFDIFGDDYQRTSGNWPFQTSRSPSTPKYVTCRRMADRQSQRRLNVTQGLCHNPAALLCCYSMVVTTADVPVGLYSAHLSEGKLVLHPIPPFLPYQLIIQLGSSSHTKLAFPCVPASIPPHYSNFHPYHAPPRSQTYKRRRVLCPCSPPPSTVFNPIPHICNVCPFFLFSEVCILCSAVVLAQCFVLYSFISHVPYIYDLITYLSSMPFIPPPYSPFCHCLCGADMPLRFAMATNLLNTG